MFYIQNEADGGKANTANIDLSPSGIEWIARPPTGRTLQLYHPYKFNLFIDKFLLSCDNGGKELDHRMPACPPRPLLNASSTFRIESAAELPYNYSTNDAL